MNQQPQKTVLMVGGRMDVCGTSRYTLNLATGLVRQGWQVHLACGDGELLGEFEAAGIQVLPRHLPPGLFQLPFAAHSLARAVRSIEPRVIHIQTEDVLPASVLAFRNTVTPMLLTIHRAIRQPRTIPRRHLRRLSAVIAVSDVVRADLVNKRRVPREIIAVVHNGVPVETNEKARPAAGPRTPVVGTMSRIERGKGIEYLLAAGKEVLKQKPEAFFLIAGDGPQRRPLRDLAITLGIEQKVCFAAAVPDHIPILSSLDVFVVPSVDEGLGMAILEAMAMGKPVVATARSSTYVTIKDGETGILVPPSDPPALARAILTLLDDQNLCSRLGAAAREVVRRKFNVASMVAQTEALYNEPSARQ